MAVVGQFLRLREKGGDEVRAERPLWGDQFDNAGRYVALVHVRLARQVAPPETGTSTGSCLDLRVIHGLGFGERRITVERRYANFEGHGRIADLTRPEQTAFGNRHDLVRLRIGR